MFKIRPQLAFLSFLGILVLLLFSFNSKASRNEDIALATAAEPPGLAASTKYVLEADPALAATVSFEATRLNVSLLLDELTRKSGVTLKVGDGFPAGKLKVTGYMSEVPLRLVLESLSRMYGVSWQKVGEKDYMMKAGVDSALDTEILKIGDPFRLRFKYSVDAQQDEQFRRGFAETIFATANKEDLLSKDGIAITSLNDDLQQALRRGLEELNAPIKIKEYASSLRAAELPLYLHYGPPPANPGRDFPGAVSRASEISRGIGITIRTSDGRIICPAFSSFNEFVKTKQNVRE